VAPGDVVVPREAADATAARDAASKAASQTVTPPDFFHADTDFDARISFAEAQKIWPNMTQAQFDAADTDHTGYLGADEYQALLAHPPM
jgi:hypothetical protein